MIYVGVLAGRQASPDVGVGVRRVVVDIAVQRTRICAIVPIAADIAHIASRGVEVPVVGRSIDNPIDSDLLSCSLPKTLHNLHIFKSCAA